MADRRDEARTVMPSPAAARGSRRTDPGRLLRLATPVLDFIEGMEDANGREDVILAEARVLLDRFEAAALDAGETPSAVPPARYALAVLIDQKARTFSRLSIRRWSALSFRQLFDGRDISLDRVRDFRETARGRGEDYADLVHFLDHLIDRAERDRRTGWGRRRSAWPLWAAAGMTALVLALAGYALALEYSYQARLSESFLAETLELGLDRPKIGADLGVRLDRLEASVERVEVASSDGPLSRAMAISLLNAGRTARATYEEAVARHLPGVMAGAMGEVLASEGDGLALYDTLRARAILTGETTWSVEYLAGWLADLSVDDPILAHLPAHVIAMSAPPESLPAQDPELLAQARVFAREASEPARAYLEMRRSGEAAALVPWRADLAVPGLVNVVLRRSGQPLSEPVPGVFTVEGWDWARDFGAGLAVQRARAEAPALLGAVPRQVNDAPDKVLDQLHEETLAFWQGYLADLRVRPFGDPVASVRISGLLAAADSPLASLLREVWVQAGGLDRRRGHARQLRLATVFGPMIQYVESGKMSEIASLFASLNVALSTMDVEDDRAAERLMSIRVHVASVAALKTAPLVVVQIVEDVLAQTSAAHADILTNPITRSWQTAVLPLCQRVIDGRFPLPRRGRTRIWPVLRIYSARTACFSTSSRARSRPISKARPTRGDGSRRRGWPGFRQRVPASLNRR